MSTYVEWSLPMRYLILSGQNSETRSMQSLQIAMRPSIVKRSLIVALVVGTVLNLINQGDVITGNAHFNLFKCLLTYVVPYLVSTYGAVSALKESAPEEDALKESAPVSKQSGSVSD